MWRTYSMNFILAWWEDNPSFKISFFKGFYFVLDRSFIFFIVRTSITNKAIACICCVRSNLDYFPIQHCEMMYVSHVIVREPRFNINFYIFLKTFYSIPKFSALISSDIPFSYWNLSILQYCIDKDKGLAQTISASFSPEVIRKGTRDVTNRLESVLCSSLL